MEKFLKKKFVFRCDAGNIPEIGTGHVSRCLLIAKSLIKENVYKLEEMRKRKASSNIPLVWPTVWN